MREHEVHLVHLGDELHIAGCVFIITGFRVDLDQPPVLNVEPPIALAEVPK